MSPEEDKLSKDAVQWIKNNKKRLIDTFASISNYLPDPSAITVFMAGSPGAGKTEIAKRLVEQFKSKPVVVDADEIRKICPGYNGTNAHIYQSAASVGVEKLHDHILKKKLNCILDGTFAHNNTIDNIGRSLKEKRKVEIFFVYQSPEVAWAFTQKREVLEHRRIRKADFVKGFINSRIRANEAKTRYNKDIRLNVVIRSFETGLDELHLNVDSVDSWLPKVYSESDLSALIP